MKKTIDISDYDSFIDAGFKECSKCGWAFDPNFFNDHSCIDMQMPAHNHIVMPMEKCPKDCPFRIANAQQSSESTTGEKDES